MSFTHKYQMWPNQVCFIVLLLVKAAATWQTWRKSWTLTPAVCVKTHNLSGKVWGQCVWCPLQMKTNVILMSLSSGSWRTDTRWLEGALQWSIQGEQEDEVRHLISWWSRDALVMFLYWIRPPPWVSVSARPPPQLGPFDQIRWSNEEAAVTVSLVLIQLYFKWLLLTMLLALLLQSARYQHINIMFGWESDLSGSEEALLMRPSSEEVQLGHVRVFAGNTGTMQEGNYYNIYYYCYQTAPAHRNQAALGQDGRKWNIIWSQSHQDRQMM